MKAKHGVGGLYGQITGAESESFVFSLFSGKQESGVGEMINRVGTKRVVVLSYSPLMLYLVVSVCSR